ncbi:MULTISPECIES: hypothetical protein [unclassified Paenibacillus]|uniref:hypothetical protein n=1 Tax=unclassified Paenibacillus TaxID=185978 RepID=UPI003625DF10
MSTNFTYLAECAFLSSARMVLRSFATLSSMKIMLARISRIDRGRGCAVFSDGRFLLVGALDGHEVVTYPMGEAGKISPAVSSFAQPIPGTINTKY